MLDRDDVRVTSKGCLYSALFIGVCVLVGLGLGLAVRVFQFVAFST